MANFPGTVDFTTTQVQNPAAGRQRLGINLVALEAAIAAAAAQASAAQATATAALNRALLPGARGATGATGATGPAGPPGPSAGLSGVTLGSGPPPIDGSVLTLLYKDTDPASGFKYVNLGTVLVPDWDLI